MDINILLALQAFRNGPGSVLGQFLSKMTFLGEMNTILILLPLVKGAISGPACTLYTCYIQMIYIVLIFPLCIKCWNRVL